MVVGILAICIQSHDVFHRGIHKFSALELKWALFKEMREIRMLSSKCYSIEILLKTTQTSETKKWDLWYNSYPSLWSFFALEPNARWTSFSSSSLTYLYQNPLDRLYRFEEDDHSWISIQPGFWSMHYYVCDKSRWKRSLDDYSVSELYLSSYLYANGFSRLRRWRRNQIVS